MKPRRARRWALAVGLMLAVAVSAVVGYYLGAWLRLVTSR